MDSVLAHWEALHSERQPERSAAKVPLSISLPARRSSAKVNCNNELYSLMHLLKKRKKETARSVNGSNKLGLPGLVGSRHSDFALLRRDKQRAAPITVLTQTRELGDGARVSELPPGLKCQQQAPCWTWPMTPLLEMRAAVKWIPWCGSAQYIPLYCKNYSGEVREGRLRELFTFPARRGKNQSFDGFSGSVLSEAQSDTVCACYFQILDATRTRKWREGEKKKTGCPIRDMGSCQKEK